MPKTDSDSELRREKFPSREEKKFGEVERFSLKENRWRKRREKKKGEKERKERG